LRDLSMRKRTLYLILKIILSQWRDFRSNVMKFRSFGDSTSSRVEDKLKTIHYKIELWLNLLLIPVCIELGDVLPRLSCG